MSPTDLATDPMAPIDPIDPVDPVCPVDPVATRAVNATRAATDLTGGLAIVVAGVALRLLADRAVWWPEAGTLFVADVHLGKAESFSALGVPVPRGPTGATLDRLSALIDACGATRLVVLGDLVLCGPVVEREARDQGKTLEAHYAHLLVHGTLHAQGWDHETNEQDALAMETAEILLMGALGFPDPY
jgi:rRNA maturation RNase YbeY